MELVAAFRTALGDRAGGDELAAVVTAAAERARAAWPQFAIADERLGRRLGELVADEPDPAAAL
ncbi:MAG TPA: hypothetical protein VLX92_35295, partial [Kofleriaceae bacterium]|nr:hypothetical protein [Kofleriaceae bacterium]